MNKGMDRSLTLVNGGVEEETKKVQIDRYKYFERQLEIDLEMTKINMQALACYRTIPFDRLIEQIDRID